MTENLNKRPRKSILKSSSSFDKPQQTPQALPVVGNQPVEKCAKFDEMNIIETLHPPDKDYGHMKIEEPRTPFHYLEEDSESLLDADVLRERISSKSHSPPRGAAALESDWDPEEDAEEADADADEDPEEKRVFESKRKAHYNEYYAVKLARKLMEEDEEEDQDQNPQPEGAVKFIPAEEVEIMEET